MENCPPGEERPFAWRDVLHKEFMLNTKFFVGEQEYISEATEYSLDILNREFRLNLKDSQGNNYEVYVTAYTNQFQKVLEISDEPSKHKFKTQ